MKNRGKQSDRKKLLGTEGKSSPFKRVAVVSVAGLVVCLFALGIFLYLGSVGFFLKNTVSARTQNFNVDSAMMSYFLYEEYREFINENYDNIDEYNIKNDISLKKQKCCLLDNKSTWFDYFKEKAQSTVKEQLLFVEGARKHKISLSLNDKRSINKKIEQLKDSARRTRRTEKEQLEFLYGKGVDIDTVEKCLELKFISKRFYDTLIAGKIDASDAAMNGLFEQYREKATSCDYVEYSVEAQYDIDNATEQEVEKAFLVAKDKAEQVAGYDQHGFIVAVTESRVSALKESYGTNITDSERVDIYNSMITRGVGFDGSDLAVWCFDESRKPGDTVVLRGEKGYSVYKMVKTAYREDYVTKNVRIITTTAKKYGNIDKAYQEIAYVYKDWQESDKSVVAFENLAYKYSEDTQTNLTGGLYKNVEHFEFESDVEGWIFDDDRESGDCEVIKTNEKCYLVCFVGNGLVRWKARIYEAELERRVESMTKELSEQVEVKFFEKQISRVKI